MDSSNLNNIIDVVYLTPGNAEFSVSDNKFLQLKATVKHPVKVSEDKENQNGVKEEEFIFERVFLHRAFPFDNPYEYISVSGQFPKTPEELQKEEENKRKKEEEEKKKKEAEPESKENKESASPAPLRENTTSLGDLKEIGIITKISDFGDIQSQYLKYELDRKYFIPMIEQILAVKEKYGFSYWEVKTNIGKIKFTVHDAYRQMIKVTDDRIIVNDVNGNRYEIPSLNSLDRQSFRKIELFL